MNIDKIDAVEVQERLDWPSTAPGYCDTWLMVNAGDLSFKASEQYPVSAMANIGHQLLQEIAAYRPGFEWTTSPAEIVGALIDEMHAQSKAPMPPVAVPDGWQATDDEIAAWNTRHDLRISSATDRRAVFEDAQTLRPQLAAPAAQGDAKELTDDELIQAVHSVGVDTHPSKYGFNVEQIEGMSITVLRQVIAAVAANKAVK